MSDVDSGPDGAETDQNDATNTDTFETAENASDGAGDGNADDSADTFPHEYVESLRKENRDHRTKTDALAKRLHVELVRATGKLENAADLPFNAEHLDDADKLSAAIDALITERPYFAKRKVAGDAGQGPRGGGKDASPTFADLFK